MFLILLRVDDHEMILDSRICIHIFIFIRVWVNMVINISMTVYMYFFSGLCFHISYESSHLLGTLSKTSLDFLHKEEIKGSIKNCLVKKTRRGRESYISIWKKYSRVTCTAVYQLPRDMVQTLVTMVC